LNGLKISIYLKLDILPRHLKEKKKKKRKKEKKKIISKNDFSSLLKRRFFNKSKDIFFLKAF
jgi:hypothetical protein